MERNTHPEVKVHTLKGAPQVSIPHDAELETRLQAGVEEAMHHRRTHISVSFGSIGVITAV